MGFGPLRTTTGTTGGRPLDTERVGAESAEQTNRATLAWLARFGRTVAQQVLDSVEERLAAPREPGTRGTLAGQSFGRGGAQPDSRPFWPSQDNAHGSRGPGTQALTGYALLQGTDLALASETAGRGLATAWSRGADSRFEGIEGDLSRWTCYHWNDRCGLRQSAMDVGTRGRNKPWRRSRCRTLRTRGRRSASLRHLPLCGVPVEGLCVWLAGGYCAGSVALDPEGAERIDTDMNLAMAAAGVRNSLTAGEEIEGLDLALEADGLWIQTSSSTAGILAATKANVTRVRLGFAGGHVQSLESGGTIGLALGVGAGRDGGDAETGPGADIRGSASWIGASQALSASIGGRALLTHAAEGFRDWSISGSLTYDLEPNSRRGLSLSLRPEIGSKSPSAMVAAPAIRSLAGIAEGAAPRGSTLGAEAGYGLAIDRGSLIVTPGTEYSVDASGKEFRVGVRVETAGRRMPDLLFAVHGTERKSNERADVENAVGLRLDVRW